MGSYSYIITSVVGYVPGLVTATYLTGINNVGQVVGAGYFMDPLYFGEYVYGNGIRTNFSFLNGGKPIPGDINDYGDVVGSLNGLGVFFEGVLHTASGFDALINAPSASSYGTHPEGINNAGQIVGSYVDTSLETRGFLFDSGSYTDLEYPSSSYTVATDINNVGQIIGYYADANNLIHGFIYDNGVYTSLDNPLASASTPGSGTFLTGNNDTGQIVGYYGDAGGGNHSFLYDRGTFTAIDNIGIIEGINNLGQIVGSNFIGNIAFSAEKAGAMVYTHQYGAAPDAAELAVLTSFTVPQYAYGQLIGVMDPVIYAYQALGFALAPTAMQFQNDYGPTNAAYPNSLAGDTQFISDAYLDVFDRSANPEQVEHFIDQLHYFQNLYANEGVFGTADNIDLLARGAVYGQMWGFEAELNPFGI